MYSFINVAGLAFGICACIVIYLIISYEFGFDRFHPDGERIYRITGLLQMGDGEKQFINSPVPEVIELESGHSEQIVVDRTVWQIAQQRLVVVGWKNIFQIIMRIRIPQDSGRAEAIDDMSQRASR